MSTDNTPNAELVPQSAARELAQIDRQRAMAETTFGIGINPFSNGDAFKLACAIADRIAESTFIPVEYQGKPSNVLVAMDYAARLNISPVMLMQNMDVVKGRPGLRGSFYAGLINKSPLFSRLQYEWRGQDNPGKSPSLDFGCRAYTTEKASGQVIYGTWIDWRMVIGEGWDKNAKWTNLREQMFQYRAAAFWARVHASDITAGMYESEELRDALEGEFTRVETRASRLSDKLEAAEVADPAQEKPREEEKTTKRRGTRKKVKDAVPEKEPEGADDGTRPEPSPETEAGGSPPLPDDDAPDTGNRNDMFNVE